MPLLFSEKSASTKITKIEVHPDNELAFLLLDDMASTLTIEYGKALT